MLVDITKKKEFLEWLTQNVQYKIREVYWILNYLINHDVILNKMVFIENVEKTPRGLKLNYQLDKQAPLQLFIENHAFTDPEQIFHELRMNWQKDLYVEVNIEDSWNNSLYLAVLEDNPYDSWNEDLDSQFETDLDSMLKQEKEKYEMEYLYAQIDEALEQNNEEEFKRLTKLLEGEKLALSNTSSDLKE